MRNPTLNAVEKRQLKELFHAYAAVATNPRDDKIEERLETAVASIVDNPEAAKSVLVVLIGAVGFMSDTVGVDIAQLVKVITS